VGVGLVKTEGFVELLGFLEFLEFVVFVELIEVDLTQKGVYNSCGRKCGGIQWSRK
jgi:hypothetical protein